MKSYQEAPNPVKGSIQILGNRQVRRHIVKRTSGSVQFTSKESKSLYRVLWTKLE